MPSRVRKFVCRDFIRTVDLHLLGRLLKPHSGHINLDWNDLPDDETEKREVLFEFFRRMDSTCPAELQNALHCAKILSGETGCRILLEQAELAGITLTSPNQTADNAGPITPRHLALIAYLDHRALFERAVDLARIGFATNPLERIGARRGVCSREDDLICREAFRAEASGWFTKRYCGNFCEVRWYPEEDEIAILISHGRNARTANVDQDGREDTMTFREITQDVIRYRPATGRIKISAQSTKDAKQLLDLFATHMLGDKDFFQGTAAETLYSLDAVQDAGAEFRFIHEWDADLAEVIVREVKLEDRREPRRRRRLSSPWSMVVKDNVNAMRRLKEVAGDLPLKDMSLSHLKLDFHFHDSNGSRTTRIPVTIRPPSQACFQDHAFEAAIYTHLERNGLRLVPSANLPAAAAE